MFDQCSNKLASFKGDFRLSFRIFLKSLHPHNWSRSLFTGKTNFEILERGILLHKIPRYQSSLKGICGVNGMVCEPF